MTGKIPRGALTGVDGRIYIYIIVDACRAGAVRARAPREGTDATAVCIGRCFWTEVLCQNIIMTLLYYSTPPPPLPRARARALARTLQYAPQYGQSPVLRGPRCNFKYITQSLARAWEAPMSTGT